MHTIKNIPRGEMLRAWRNCTKPGDFKQEVSNIHSRLSARCYPRWTLDWGEKIASNKNRDELLRYKRDGISNNLEKKNPITFVTSFSNDYGKIKRIVESNLHILTFDPLLKTVTDRGYRCVSRRAPTLGQFLNTMQTVKPALLRLYPSKVLNELLCLCMEVTIGEDFLTKNAFGFSC